MADILPAPSTMTTPPKPYWLDSGTETCGACTHVYVYEMELRCVGCDRGICEQCVVIERLTRQTWCPECWAEAEPEAQSRDQDESGTEDG